MGAERVSVDRNELLILLEEHALLTVLLSTGVDNWSGYEFAEDLFDKSCGDLVFNSLERLEETSIEEN